MKTILVLTAMLLTSGCAVTRLHQTTTIGRSGPVILVVKPPIPEPPVPLGGRTRIPRHGGPRK